MPKIVTTEQMRAIEQAAEARGQRVENMMEMAGRAVASRVRDLLDGVPEPRIAILVGPGNNGGDGLVAGRILKEELDNATVGVYLLKARGDDDSVFARAQEAGLFMAEASADKAQGYRVLQNLVANADVVIDALFGTSFTPPVKGDAAKVLQNVRKALLLRKADRPTPGYNTPTEPDEPRFLISGAPMPLVIAVDCPSGLDCDTGNLDDHTIHADETITFGAVKPGLIKFPGASAVGTLHIGDIGLPDRLAELDQVPLNLIDATDVAGRLPDRAADAHKGTFGKTMVVAGSLNYVGAAFLAGSAAYRVGTGLVTIAAPQIIIPVLAGMLPEATWVLLPHDMGVLNEAAVKVLRKELDTYTALLVGPGLGREDETGEFMRELLQPKEEFRPARVIGFIRSDDAADEDQTMLSPLPPLVIDADGLNLLAQIEDWPRLLPPNTILTPHPGEFARLSGLSTEEIQADRITMAQQGAANWNAVVVLKGAFTVIAAPDGRTAVLPFATAALAKAGTGDVLAGAISGLLAQGLNPYDAAVAGAWLHGIAGLRAERVLNTISGRHGGRCVGSAAGCVRAGGRGARIKNRYAA